MCDECGKSAAVLVLGAPVELDALMAWAQREGVWPRDAASGSGADLDGYDASEAARANKRRRTDAAAAAELEARTLAVGSDDDDDNDGEEADGDAAEREAVDAYALAARWPALTLRCAGAALISALTGSAARCVSCRWLLVGKWR